MVIVIQCASSKQEDAPTFVTSDGRPVKFVAHPERAPSDDAVRWARPDDLSDVPGETWRQRVERQNADRTNRCRFLAAYRLYEPSIYGRLAETFGQERVRILSAGWGLVRASYLLPNYDITFTSKADEHKRRRAGDAFSDFAQVEPLDGPLVFLGGHDYLPLFTELTRHTPVRTIVPFWCSPDNTAARVRREGGWVHVPFRTTRRTNWYYECAQRLCEDPGLLEREP